MNLLQTHQNLSLLIFLEKGKKNPHRILDIPSNMYSRCPWASDTRLLLPLGLARAEGRAGTTSFRHYLCGLCNQLCANPCSGTNRIPKREGHDSDDKVFGGPNFRNTYVYYWGWKLLMLALCPHGARVYSWGGQSPSLLRHRIQNKSFVECVTLTWASGSV